jgi:hypothetical protein
MLDSRFRGNDSGVFQSSLSSKLLSPFYGESHNAGLILSTKMSPVCCRRAIISKNIRYSETFHVLKGGVVGRGVM